MLMEDTRFLEWIEHASEEENQLWMKLIDFSDLFEDMLFNPGTHSHDLLVKCGQKLPSDEYIEEEFVRPEVLTYFQLSWFNYRIENLQGISGYYNHQEQLLCISRKHLNSDYVLLHEMIHLYEDVINELPLYYHDMLYWSLYQNLRKKIPNLDEAITLHAHLLNQETTYIKGGLHDVIFLLKSFDLDIKQGYPLGTVLIYNGGKNAFKDLTYSK